MLGKGCVSEVCPSTPAETGCFVGQVESLSPPPHKCPRTSSRRVESIPEDLLLSVLSFSLNPFFPFAGPKQSLSQIFVNGLDVSFFLIKVQLIYNTVSVSGIYQSDPVICIYFFQIIFHYRLYKILNVVPCVLQ